MPASRRSSAGWIHIAESLSFLRGFFRAAALQSGTGILPIVFSMKNAEGVFPSLPARNERGESWREGKLIKNDLLSPTLSSFFGEEREKGSAAALQANYLSNRNGVSPAGHPARWNELMHSPNRPGICRSPNNRAFFPGGKMSPSTAARMAATMLKTYQAGSLCQVKAPAVRSANFHSPVR